MEKIISKISDNKRKQIIKELQDLAAEVLKLKNEHRQRRPIVIEFSGSPKAGKTSCINSLELFLKRNDFSVKIVQERASVCPVSDKQSPMFNYWTGCMSLAGMIGTLEDKRQEVDVLILDRGIFDVLCWFQWLVKNGKMEESQQHIDEQFFLKDDFVKSIDIVFVFCATPSISIEREYAHLLTDKDGTIMNNVVLQEYLDAIDISLEKYKGYFHEICKIDTSAKSQDEVGKEVTEDTLNTLKNLLMERVGYIEKTSEFIQVLGKQSIFSQKEIGIYLTGIKFDIREKVEANMDYLQPIPIVVITNLKRDKVLVVKKSNNAVTNDSPEKDKLLPYVGGHSRIEDQTEANSQDFFKTCITTLKREVKEEIGVSLAGDKINPPIYIYTPNTEKSRKHLAVCFYIEMDDTVVKMRLNSQELVSNKGKSNSGHFISINEISIDKLESWGIEIMNYFFNAKLSYTDDQQLMLFSENSELQKRDNNK